jgi:hypothetical protein
MKGKGIILLLALLVPSCIFVFLKMFGRNEFQVVPLFQERPEGGVATSCGTVAFPYVLPDSVQQQLNLGADSIALVLFGTPDKEAQRQLKRIDEVLAPIQVRRITVTADTPQFGYARACVFLLPRTADLALIDNKGRIRGQYTANDREEMDRLYTELTIILKKY